MASNSAISGFISEVQQALAKIDDGARMIGGLHWQASRLCQFTTDPERGWTPVINADGSFAMTVTDDELKEMGFKMTAQELGTALFGAVDLMSSIPTELADLIGKVRA